MRIIIITDAVYHPVSLADVKLACGLATGAIGDELATAQSVSPGSHAIATAYSLEGASIDLAGSASVLVLLEAGACGAGGSVACKLQHSDAGVVWSDVTGGAFTAVTEASDNATQELAYTGNRRYLRAVATVATAACEFGVTVVRKTSTVDLDARLTALIAEAHNWARAITGRALMAETRELQMDEFPASPFRIDCAPVRAVSAFNYKDSAGTTTTMTADTQYIVDTDLVTPDGGFATVALPYGGSWPTFTAWPLYPIRLRFTCGYSASTDSEAAQQAAVPQDIRNAMLARIRYLHDHQDAAELMMRPGAAFSLGEVETALAYPLQRYRVRWF